MIAVTYFKPSAYALAIAALLVGPSQADEVRRDPNARKGETATVRIDGDSRTLIRNDPNGRPWQDSLSTPDIVFKTSSLTRFVDDDNEGPDNAPSSRHEFGLVMENGDVYFVDAGVPTAYAGRIAEFKKNYYYVAHDFYIWNPETYPNHVVTAMTATHRCLVQANDQDKKYEWIGTECDAPGVSYLRGNAYYYKIPDTAQFSTFNPGFSLFYRRTLTYDGSITIGSGPSAFDVRWGYQWLARVGCIGSTFGPCSQWATSYDGLNERGVAASVNFAMFPHFAPGGADLRMDILPPAEGLLGSGRNGNILQSVAVAGAAATIDSTLQVAPGSKVEFAVIDFGDRLRVALVMGRYEDDPLTTSAFMIDRYKKTSAYSYGKTLNANARIWFDPLVTGASTLYIAPTLGMSLAVDATDDTAPYNLSKLSRPSSGLDLNAATTSYNFFVPPKPRYVLEGLRLKPGVTE